MFPDIDHVFEINDGFVNEVVIENQVLYRTVLMDLYIQCNGLEGKTVLSDNNVPIKIAKNIEILNQFVPFELNKKPLLNKISLALEERALSAEAYSDTLRILGEIKKHLLDLSFDMTGDLMFETINTTSLIKASGLTLSEEYDSLGEKIIDYFELVTEYDKQKLFVLVGLRAFLDDPEMTRFIETVCRTGHFVILIEPVEYSYLSGLKRYIIDKDLCEIV